MPCHAGNMASLRGVNVRATRITKLSSPIPPARHSPNLSPVSSVMICANWRGLTVAGRVAEALEKQWSRKDFDVLVNNAGASLHNSIGETMEDEFDTAMRVHLKGPYFLTQRLLPLLADGARILNISSGLARFSFPGSSAYAMMKGGIEVFTRYFAAELGSRGITAYTLAPAAIETDFSGGMVRDNPEVNRMVSQNTALGRPGRVSDIGPIVAAQVAADNRWINGQLIEASGGMRL